MGNNSPAARSCGCRKSRGWTRLTWRAGSTLYCHESPKAHEAPTDRIDESRSAAVEFSLTPSVAAGPHLFGEDTPKVLAELGLSQERINDLKQKGIVSWEEVPAR